MPSQSPTTMQTPEQTSPFSRMEISSTSSPTQLNRTTGSPRSLSSTPASASAAAAAATKTPAKMAIASSSPTNENEPTITVINPFDTPPQSETEIIDEGSVGVGVGVGVGSMSCGHPTEYENQQTLPSVHLQHLPHSPIIGDSLPMSKLARGTKMVDDNNDSRRTTITKIMGSAWDLEGGDDVAPSQYDDNDLESNPHSNANLASGTSHREKCFDCLLRLVNRMCHPHVHPPCSRRYWAPSTHSSQQQQQQQQQHHRHLSPRHRRILCRTLIILFMIVTITFTLLDLLILHQYLHHWLDSTLAWLHDHPISGGLTFIGIFVMGCLCFFPVALLSLGAGYVYIELYGLGLGIFVAFLICYSGCLLGATVCFARSRYLMRQLIIRYSAKYPIVRAVDRAFETKGFRLLLLLRLSPAMPMNALNYIGGITAISFSSYWWATCVGTAPGLLWTIFVGATFGTVDARGVDGNKEFDQDSVRKGVVLGLGIGLGVMALIGTAIYARMELKKIVLAEQMERVIEEQELFMNAEIEVGQEDGEDDDRGSVSIVDSENPQTGDWGHVSFDSIEHSRDGLPKNRRRASSHSSLNTLERHHRGITQPTWTPEAVDAELPILPKVILRCLARPSDEINTTGHERGEETNPASVWPDDSTPKNRQRSASASASPWHRRRHASDAAKVNVDALRNVGANILAPTSRRHSDGITDGALTVTPETTLRADATCSDNANEIMPSLANIYETRALSDDQLSEEADGYECHTVTSPHVMNEAVRRRCNTDPTDQRNYERQDLGATTNGASSTHSQRKKRWQQVSHVQTTPPRQKQQDMESRYSFGSLHTGHVMLNNDEECSSPRPRCNSLNTHLPQGMPRHQFSSPLPFELLPAGNHVGLDISGSADDDDDDSLDTPREWFWIWS